MGGATGHDAAIDTAGVHDAGSDRVDATSDVPPRHGGSLSIGNGGACAHQLTDPNCWSGFDVYDQHENGSFFGGAFDGRYVYFVSSGDTTTNQMTRYDTQASFGAASSWSAFNLSSINTMTQSFNGAGFDGRYVYFVPTQPYMSSTLSRYDTHGSFTDAASWSNLDLTVINGTRPNYNAVGFAGAVFDGRFLYLVPNSIYEYFWGLVTRYDTQAAFTDTASWAMFDTFANLSQTAAGFRGAAYDGRYIYFVPCCDLSTGFGNAMPKITRYDTQGTFGDVGSWVFFDATVLDNSVQYEGAAFDGRYVYFPAADYHGNIARYDTQAAFTTAASWSTFSMTAVSGAAAYPFNGAIFDGRYIYVIPGGSTLMRYDTQAAFGTAASWAAFDLSTLDPRASGFAGAAFDGRYVYLIPATSDIVLRFDARTPAVLPPHAGASFF
jgi:hypothetical protein